MTIALDQVCAAVEGGTASTLVISFATAPTPGSLVVVGIGQWDTLANHGITSVTDNQGNGNYLLATSGNDGGDLATYIYYCNNVASSGTFTITITLTTTGCDTAAGAVSYTGVADSDPLDSAVNNNNGNSATATSGAAAPTGTCLYFGVVTSSQASPAFTVSSPFTQRFELDTSVAWAPVNGCDYIGTGSQNAQWSLTSSTWKASIATFREEASALEQEGFRWRNDDGSETTATWLANQDIAITQPSATNTRLRAIVNATNDPGSKQFKLQYRKQGAASWRDVP